MKGVLSPGDREEIRTVADADLDEELQNDFLVGRGFRPSGIGLKKGCSDSSAGIWLFIGKWWRVSLDTQRQ